MGVLVTLDRQVWCGCVRVWGHGLISCYLSKCKSYFLNKSLGSAIRPVSNKIICPNLQVFLYNSFKIISQLCNVRHVDF